MQAPELMSNCEPAHWLAASAATGRVTVADLMRQARSFGVSWGRAGYYPSFDRDRDDDIDIGDLQEMAGRWRTGCPR